MRQIKELLEPEHGHTKSGRAVHGSTVDHLPSGSAYARFNKKFAVAITSRVGTMTCAYVFCILALLSLPAILSAFSIFSGVFPPAITKASIVALVAWVAQAFLQLVLLPIIIVGQNVQAEASDARAAKTFEDTESIKDAVDIETEGGIRILSDKIDALEEHILNHVCKCFPHDKL